MYAEGDPRRVGERPAVGEVPPEALLLAMVQQLGRMAAELLGQAGFAPRSLAGVSTPQAALRRLLDRYPPEAASAPALGPGGPTRREPDGQPVDSGKVREIARLLGEYWAGRAPVAVLDRYGERIDPASPQGRWEVLALAVLLGAPVARHRVEETFCALRREGLLDLGAAASGAEPWARAVDAVMDASYRGRVDRRRQRHRLHRAAAVLTARFGGDLDEVWRQAGGDPASAVQLIRDRFEGVDRLAAWVVREMGRMAAWPGADRHPAAAFADAHVRRVLENLGLVPADWPREAVQAFVRRHFGSLSSVLFSHGKDLCGRESPAVCLKRCPAAAWCRAWRRWEDADHPDADPAGPRPSGEGAGGAAQARRGAGRAVRPQQGERTPSWNAEGPKGGEAWRDDERHR